MREALYAPVGGGCEEGLLATVDFRAQGATGRQGKAAEAQRFIARAKWVVRRAGGGRTPALVIPPLIPSFRLPSICFSYCS